MENKDVKILYEDDLFLAIDKPAGLMVHPDGRGDEYTLIDWIVKHYPNLEGVGEKALYNGEEFPRPGIVHRIDKDTTGVILLAKTQESFEYLKNEFQERRVEKTYQAIVYDNVKKDMGRIERAIGRSKKDFRQWAVDSDIRGVFREAITDYKVLFRGENCTFLEVYPKTGRTHQIRVHLKAIRHPIVCDELYAEKRPCLFGLTRMALHAHRVSFKYKEKGLITISSPLPKDIEDAVAQMGMV